MATEYGILFYDAGRRGTIVRRRDHLGITSGANTGRVLYVHILNNSKEECTGVNSIVITSIGGTTPGNIMGGNRIIGTIVIHAAGNMHHSSNRCVHFSRGTTMVVGRSGAPHNAHVFKPMTERLHSGSCVGVLSLTPRMLW